MVVFFAIITALLIVCGQALWKAAVVSVTDAHIHLLSSEGLLHLLKSPRLYLGVLVYGVATVCYILLLGKYKYFQVQSLVVGGSLVLTLALAALVFHEHINALNMVGIALIVGGALLVIR